MVSTLKTRNILVAGRRTSVRLEPAMWRALAEIARRERCTIHDVCTQAAVRNGASTLTAGLRVYIMEYYRELVASAGLIETAS
jgi:predicted DNA-binding ribbon-helix-helix protein